MSDSPTETGEIDPEAIAILGGTGDQGLGLALRFAKAGRPVVIGSRKEERAKAAVEEVLRQVPEGRVSGFGNAEATRKARIVIVSVPFEHTASTVKSIRDEHFRAGESEHLRGCDSDLAEADTGKHDARVRWDVDPSLLAGLHDDR